MSLPVCAVLYFALYAIWDILLSSFSQALGYSFYSQVVKKRINAIEVSTI